MSFYEYLPHEHSYALMLAIHDNLYPWDSMITNMLSERYPRAEDVGASTSDSKIDEDEEFDDAVLTTFAYALQETLAYQDCILYMTIESKS